ncbi:YkgJ family cysteine cluster protein [candidate division KSB1 bacterium]|nr:YkgJ family cysteine cluster protein [candidate division KSB1 bacterium]
MLSNASGSATDLRQVQRNMHLLLLALKLASKRHPFRLTLDQKFRHLLEKLYHQFDWFAAAHLAERKKIIHCKPGCSLCCYHYVDSVYAFEILNIYGHLKSRSDFEILIRECKSRYQTYIALVETHRNHSSASLEATEEYVLEQYAQLKLTCPFLQNHLCTIYEWRPFSCRAYFSLSAPHFCQPNMIYAASRKTFLIQASHRSEKIGEEIDLNMDGFGHNEGGLFAGIVKFANLADASL